MGHGSCSCGKLKFTEIEATYIVGNSRFNSRSYYKCPLSDGYFHTSTARPKGKNTRKRSFGEGGLTGFNIKRITQELQAQNQFAKKEEAMPLEDHTLTKSVVAYMRALNRDSKIYKVSSRMVADNFKSQYSRATVYSQLSEMKKAKIITSLDERVPDQRGAVYFALTEILDEMTKPVEAKTVSKITSPVPSQIKAKPQAPTSISETLEIIQTQLQGLVKGYVDIVEHQKNTRIAMEAIAGYEKPAPSNTIVGMHDSLLKQLEKMPLFIRSEIAAGVDTINTRIKTELDPANPNSGISFIDKRVSALLKTASTSSDNNYKAIAELIRDTTVDLDATSLVDVLTDLTNPDSLVYKLRDGINLPVDKTSDSGSDDYKAGFRDGLKMAIEMGLKL